MEMRDERDTRVTKVTKKTFIHQKTVCVSYRFKFYKNTKEKLCRSVASCNSTRG